MKAAVGPQAEHQVHTLGPRSCTWCDRHRLVCPHSSGYNIRSATWARNTGRCHPSCFTTHKGHPCLLCTHSADQRIFSYCCTLIPSGKWAPSTTVQGKVVRSPGGAYWEARRLQQTRHDTSLYHVQGLQVSLWNHGTDSWVSVSIRENGPRVPSPEFGHKRLLLVASILSFFFNGKRACPVLGASETELTNKTLSQLFRCLSKQTNVCHGVTLRSPVVCPNKLDLATVWLFIHALFFFFL